MQFLQNSVLFDTCSLRLKISMLIVPTDVLGIIIRFNFPSSSLTSTGVLMSWRRFFNASILALSILSVLLLSFDRPDN